MTPEEIRAKALELSVRIRIEHGATAVPNILDRAREFESYITGPKDRYTVSARRIDTNAVQYTAQPAESWGPPCTGCGHATGLHLGVGGCHALRDVNGVHVYCECTLTEAEASAPAPEASAP